MHFHRFFTGIDAGATGTAAPVVQIVRGTAWEQESVAFLQVLLFKVRELLSSSCGNLYSFCSLEIRILIGYIVPNNNNGSNGKVWRIERVIIKSAILFLSVVESSIQHYTLYNKS